jgi:transcription elongation factor S-II|tara:strand:+ start:1007 stop:1516 length:510 start_codon:yes stop_codon:yes gene_type:complete
MRKVENPEEFRTNVRKALIKFIDNEKICSNLEKGIYNFSIKEAKDRNVVKKWDNVYFTHLYFDRLRTVIANLKNPNLRDKISSKEIKAHKLAFMSHQEMMPERWQKMVDEKKIRDQNRAAPKLEASTDNFTCRKCKSKECSYYQLQTRSADEPMTTFVTCLPCGNRWKC